MAETTDWLRVRGIGRERFAGYLAEFLESAGFEIARQDTTEPAESRVDARLSGMNPAVPDAGREIRFRVYPTGGGAAASWTYPTEMPVADRPRMDRFVREFVAHVERSVMTGSHATAKVTRVPGSRYPWES
ncbi:MAG TPA: hypothetical protein VEY07_01835 [Thermoplasmata archaeon]|nr:hypothetical protein [Thermoplasmata archaeon]